MTTLSTYIPLPIANNTVRGVALAFLGSILIAISAQITVPMFPVPMTLQTLAVLSVAMVLGSRFGTLALVFYMIEGAMGLPVFAGGKIGAVAFFGGSAGYLFGYVMAAYVVGTLAEKGWDRTFLKTAAAMLIGNVVLYIPGLLWLGMLFGWDKPILAWGLTPFIVGDLVKLACAAAFFSLMWQKIEPAQTETE